MSVLQGITTAMLTRDVPIQMGVLHAAVIQGTLVMELPVKVNLNSNFAVI